MGSLNIVDKDPSQGHQPITGLEPLSLADNQFDATGLAPIPTDGCPGASGSSNHLLGLGKLAALDARPTDSATALRRGQVKLGASAEAADQRGVAATVLFPRLPAK